MTINTTLPPAIASVGDDPQFNLENALTNIHGLAHVLMALATSDSVEEDELSYLGGQLIRHEEAAQDAMCRILKIGDYREQPAPAEVPEPTPLADDAAFLAAERELFEVKRQKAALDEGEHRAEYEKLDDRMHELED
jgi:hypothetical protein